MSTLQRISLNSPGITLPSAPSLTMRNGEQAQTSPERSERPPQDHVGQGRGIGFGSPGFGGGAYFDEEAHEVGTPLKRRTRNIGLRLEHRLHPEDNIPKGCSLQSIEPLREWFCKGADMTSPAEYEAALCQLEEDPPDIRQFNVNIREERRTHFSLEDVKFPAATVDVIQRGEALAIFERDRIIHFQQESYFKGRSTIFVLSVLNL